MRLLNSILAFAFSLSSVYSRDIPMERNEIADWVNDKIASAKVVVFSRSMCSYCEKAAEFLKGVVPHDLHVVKLDDAPRFSEIMAHFKEITGAATVPRIFIGGKFFGGCDHLMAQNEAGALTPVLEEAGCTVVEDKKDL